jgi:hypothetical protein
MKIKFTTVLNCFLHIAAKLLIIEEMEILITFSTRASFITSVMIRAV